MRLTAVYVPVPEGYVAFVEELPGVNIQGTPSTKPARTCGKRWNWFWRPTAN